MRVLLDATAVPADRGGVGRYVEALVPELAGCGVDLVLVTKPGDAAAFAAAAPAARVVPAPLAGLSRTARLAWEQTGLVELVRAVAPDVVHSPHYTMPRFSPRPVVVTLHDATFFSHPGAHTPVKREFFRRATRAAVRRAAALVVPSAATAEEVRRFAGGPPELFHVAYHGVDRALFRPVPEADRARVRASLGLEGPYVAFLGTLEPRKNVPALVRGWAQAVRDLPEPPALVLAGGSGWDAAVEPAIEEVRRTAPHLTLLRPGYLPLTDLAAYLCGAEVVAYPSIGEGFGLPVLEAMACGAPVLTTRALSLPEVGGDAVAYTGADADGIATSLAELLADRPRRSWLAAAGMERAAGFTWAAAAQAHVAAYESAARSARR